MLEREVLQLGDKEDHDGEDGEPGHGLSTSEQGAQMVEGQLCVLENQRGWGRWHHAA